MVCPVGLPHLPGPYLFGGIQISVPTSICGRLNSVSSRVSVILQYVPVSSARTSSHQYASACPQHDTCGLSGCRRLSYQTRSSGSVFSHWPRSRALAVTHQIANVAATILNAERNLLVGDVEAPPTFQR